jgi:hypothetical protein
MMGNASMAMVGVAIRTPAPVVCDENLSHRRGFYFILKGTEKKKFEGMACRISRRYPVLLNQGLLL